MEFQYLGTAAAEGVPALFCGCENCLRSRRIGGRAIRTRSQAIIDGTLLIDFPADSYAHFLREQIDMLRITDCLITHTHTDHLYAPDLDMLKPGFSHPGESYRLRLWGSAKVGEALAGHLPPQHTSFTELRPFAPTVIGGKYTVTALPAIHDPHAGPFFYQITDGEKTLLYAHDTHYFADEVWAYWEESRPHFDMVSLDCTNASLPLTYVGHMGIAENVQVRRRMLDMGIADLSTRFICNHYSHNGTNVVYDDFLPVAGKEGFLVSYDGMKITL